MSRLILLVLLVSCAGQTVLRINSGSYEKEGKNGFIVRIASDAADPDYTFLRVAYELCKPKGVTVISKSLMQLSGVDPWVEGRIDCEGPLDRYFEIKYSKAVDKFITEQAEGEWNFRLEKPQQ